MISSAAMASKGRSRAQRAAEARRFFMGDHQSWRDCSILAISPCRHNLEYTRTGDTVPASHTHHAPHPRLVHLVAAPGEGHGAAIHHHVAVRQVAGKFEVLF